MAPPDSRAPHRLSPIRCRLHAPAFALVVALACGDGVAPDDSGGVRVLFVGNSLAEFNDLPEVFRSLAIAGGVRAPAIGSVLRSGYSLSDHRTHSRVHAGGARLVRIGPEGRCRVVA